MRSIQDLDVKSKRVLVRVDFNVPLDDQGNITDDNRIRSVLPTIRYILDQQGKLILMSHMGRPKGKPDPALTLAPAARRLSELLDKKIEMAPDCIGPEVEKLVSQMKPGDVVLLENLRFHAGEKSNDPEFAKKLAALCDVYINDAFAACHRAHASVDGIVRQAPKSGAGFLLKKEIDYFRQAMEHPRRPLVAVLGGAKTSTKIGALENMMGRVDKFIVGGAMANTFLKSLGHDMGASRVEADLIETAGATLDAAEKKGIRFYLPVDVVAADRVDPKAQTRIVPVQEVPEGWMALDIGPATTRLFGEALEDARTIIWNGPMGIFEMDAFARGTDALAQSIADAHALTIVGGGDTGVAVHNTGLANRFSYISTGGGAFLELMEGKELPGVAALA